MGLENEVQDIHWLSEVDIKLFDAMQATINPAQGNIAQKLEELRDQIPQYNFLAKTHGKSILPYPPTEEVLQNLRCRYWEGRCK